MGKYNDRSQGGSSSEHPPFEDGSALADLKFYLHLALFGPGPKTVPVREIEKSPIKTIVVGHDAVSSWSGPKATTLESLARRVGASTSTLHRVFSGPDLPNAELTMLLFRWHTSDMDLACDMWNAASAEQNGLRPAELRVPRPVDVRHFGRILRGYMATCAVDKVEEQKRRREGYYDLEVKDGHVRVRITPELPPMLYPVTIKEVSARSQNKPGSMSVSTINRFLNGHSVPSQAMLENFLRIVPYRIGHIEQTCLYAARDRLAAEAPSSISRETT